jgi:hypothetical protein
MTHAPSAKPPASASLYDRDVYAWAQEQARLLKAGRLGEIDAENIAEEILDVGRNEYDKLQSALTVLLMHMLKWDYQPERRSRSWEATILEQRDRVEEQLHDNPSLKARIPEASSRAYRRARLRASGETGMDRGGFPEVCPYDWDAIMKRAFER